MAHRTRPILALLSAMIFCAPSVPTARAQVGSLSATTITFGNVGVGASAVRNLQISNTGTSNLIITSITTSGNFQWSNCGSAAIVPNGNCTVSVSFTPLTTGSSTGSLTITGNASNSPQVVSLSGTGVLAVTFSPASLTFSNQAINTTSVTKTITLVNNQAVALNITSITTSGSFSAAGCSATVAAQSSCPLSVTFTPSVLGTNTGTLTVTDSANNSPQTVSLTGSGAQPVTFSPSGTLAFINQAVNTTSAAKTVSLTNNQSVALNFSSITATANYAASSCASPLAPYASCSINVTFTPTTTGTISGTLTVADDANTSPQTLSVSGIGVLAVSLVPSGLQFTSQPVGSTTPPKTVVLSNNQSTALIVTSVTVTGPFAATTCPASIPPGGSCAISVTSTPTAVGQLSGTLTVVDSAATSPQTATLYANGSAVQLTSITVTPAGPSIPAGTTQAFAATGNYNSGTTANITTSVIWSSSATSVAAINSVGVATAVAAGSVTINASSGSVSGSAMLSVSPPVLVSLAVTPANFTLAPSTTQQFLATGTYTDGSTQNLTSSVSWSSANGAVATIGATGLATGVSAGTTAITATSGSIAGTTNLTVGNLPTLVSIAVTPVSLSLALGVSQQFTATGTYSDGSTQSLTGSALTWSAGGVVGGNSVVGTISSAGFYMAPSALPNPAQIAVVATSTATPSVSGSTTVTLAKVMINVSPATAQLPADTTQQFAATVTGPSNTAVIWSADGVVGGNSTVGTISGAGLYTAPATVPTPPQVTITATSAADGVTNASATITVTAPIAVTVAPTTTQQVIHGQTQQFTATVTGSSNTAVTWSIGDIVGGNNILGTVSPSGLYTAPLWVPYPSLLTIWATSVADPTKSASGGIRVIPSPTGGELDDFPSNPLGTARRDVAVLPQGRGKLELFGDVERQRGRGRQLDVRNSEQQWSVHRSERGACPPRSL